MNSEIPNPYSEFPIPPFRIPHSEIRIPNSEFQTPHSFLSSFPIAANFERMIRRSIPNAITLLNLFLGSIAVVLILEREYVLACWLLAGAGLADFLDGAVARMLGVKSELGGQLDSLADMVSFGLVPGLMYFQLLRESFGFSLNSILPAAPAFLVTVFSALRLAKFNLDTRQQEGFIGLPTPASTIFAAGILLIFANDVFGLAPLASTPALLYPLIILMSYLLVAELPLFSLKFSSLSWKGNEIRIIFVLLSAALLIILRELGLVVIIILYLLLSILFKPKVPHEVSSRD